MLKRDIEQELKLSLLKHLDACYAESLYCSSTLIDGKLTVNELGIKDNDIAKVIEISLKTKFHINKDGLIITTIIE